jgi:curli biogenesis system outer membrane secretion channel CsgG
MNWMNLRTLSFGTVVSALLVSSVAYAQAGCDENDPAYDPISCPSQSEPAKRASPAKSDGNKSENNKYDGKILTQNVAIIPGPKRTVAVGRVDAIGAFTSKYGSWDVGGGLGAMLTTALIESNRFIVIERAQLQKTLSEQELKGNKLTNQSTGPQLGKLIGVQFLIFGSVTEFGADDKGGGMSFGLSGGAIGSLLSGAFSRQSTSGTVAMDFRIVDTTTGRVLQSYRVKEVIDNSSWDVSLGYKGVSMGTNQFMKTPLGQAARVVITRAVRRIATSAGDTAWTGQVVDFDQGEVYINAGKSSGLKVGDAFMIERVVKRLTDPTTNEVLMIRKKPIGMVEIKTVAPKIAFGPFQPLDIGKPQRGDLVVVLKK